jgi:hypothetical protein
MNSDPIKRGFSRSEPAEKLILAFELFEFGVEIQRGNLSRRHPDLSASEVEALLLAWLTERTDEHPGTRIDWPRT